MDIVGSVKPEDVLRAATVRVGGGPKPGAGFFVAPRLVLTCVHVVGTAKRLILRQGDTEWGATPVTLLCHLGRPIPALDEDYPDVALLEADAEGPACVELEEDWPAHNTGFQTYGYPDEGGSIELTPARLSYRGKKGSDPVAFIDLSADTVKPGMSGGALLNLGSRAVCGIVVATRNRASPEGGLAVPWAILKPLLPDVADANRRFHLRRHLPTSARNYDPTQHGIYPLLTWSRDRRLTISRLESTFVGTPTRRHLFDVPEWHARVAELKAAGTGGKTAYLVSVEVDHGEHERAHHLRVAIAQSHYAESLATMEMANESTILGPLLESAVQSGLDTLLSVVPPTSLTGSVAIIASSGRFLVLRRSLSVRTFQRQWTPCVNETMKYVDEPGAVEDFYALARRALKEELGLDPQDYGPIVISWLGWSHPAASFFFVAMVSVHLSEVEIEIRRGQSHSVYEHDSVAWLPITADSIGAVITGGPCPDGTDRWSYFAPLVAEEIWRCHALTRPLREYG